MEHNGPTVGRLKRLGRLGLVREQICLVCTAVLEAFGTAWTVSGPIQLAKSESIGSLRIGAIGYSDWLCAANQPSVGRAD